MRPGYWFAPKLFGWGATPVTWQGWLSTGAFVLLLMVGMRILPNHAARLAYALPLTLGFALLACRKTDGGCRWHWGARR
ncbi:hypothetical protein GCM10023219_07480 [Stakelama sediminis]